MTVHTVSAPHRMDDTWKAAAGPILALVLGVIVLGLLFANEAATAVQTWIDSTAYSHCFFVIPIAAYLAWDRKHLLAGVPIAPLPAAVLLILPLGLAWLAAERVGVMEGRQLMAMAMLEVLFLAVLGWRMFRVLAAPLLYLFFLVPFGAFVTPALQDFTAGFINVGLTLLGIPHYSDAYIIDIPAGRFYVAEACAGLRFLIASIAFGVLYALLMYRSLGRRIGFMAASIVIPIIANGFRALGIVVLGQILGSAQAAAADHIIYGWVFFSIVIMLLILAGLPFREDSAPPTRDASPAVPVVVSGRPLLVAAILILVAAVGPAISASLDYATRTPLSSPGASLTIPSGCTATPAGAPPGAMVARVTCPQGTLAVMVQVFPPRSNPARMLVAQRQITGELLAEDASFSSLDIPGMAPHWRVVSTNGPARVTVSALWIDGSPAQGGLAGRLVIARNSILGSRYAPVLVSVTVQPKATDVSPEEKDQILRFIGGFLQRQTTLPAQLARVATGGGQ